MEYESVSIFSKLFYQCRILSYGGETIMKRSTKTTRNSFLLSILLLMFISVPVAQAKTMNRNLWTFDFKNCALSEALHQISKETGIQIICNKNLENLAVNKSFNNLTIEQIINDIIRENYAIVWHYIKKGLDTIEILIVDGKSGGKSFTAGGFLKNEQANRTDDSRNSAEHKYTIGQRTHMKNTKSNTLIRSKKLDYINESGGKSLTFDTQSDVFWAANRSESIDNHDIVSEKSENTQEQETKNFYQSSKTGSETIAGENSSTDAPPPIPGKWHGLEPPPMPPGFASEK